MKKELLSHHEIKLVGLSARTNNANEMQQLNAKIGPLLQQYYTQHFAERIKNKIKPGVTFSVYTNYASDEHGDYTYFIGEEVSSFANVPADMQTLIIPNANYQKFTTAVGVMPMVVIDAWGEIWQMSAEQLSAPRAYVADFEIYDDRAKDPNNTVVDIWIGLQS